MDEMFEFDWSCIQRPQFKNPDQELEVKKVLKENYWMIREIYKYQASIGTTVGSSPFAIPLNQYYEFIKQAKVLKDKGITVTEADTVFLVINKRYKPHKMNPGNALIRYQFLEILLRLGLKKAGKSTAFGEVMKNFIEDDVVPTHKMLKAQDFREKYYWNEYIDNLYKSHAKLLEELYNTYSGSKTLPGEERFMHLTEFEYLLNDS